jgi:hypothetical protein
MSTTEQLDYVMPSQAPESGLISSEVSKHITSPKLHPKLFVTLKVCSFLQSVPIFHWVMEENDVFGNRWLQGLAPADIVPDLAKLARHKLLTVA